MNRDVCEHSVPTHLYCEKCAFLMEFRQLQQTHRREWQGLTEEEINELSHTMVKGHKSVNWLARAIEAKLKERNNG